MADAYEHVESLRHLRKVALPHAKYATSLAGDPYELVADLIYGTPHMLVPRWVVLLAQQQNITGLGVYSDIEEWWRENCLEQAVS